MTRLNKDVLSGLLFVVVGVAGLWISRDYQVGNAFRMGPGYFPRLLCALLVGLGVIIALKGFVSRGELPERLHIKPLVLVTGAVLAFAGLMATVGLGPATAAVVLIGAAGGPEFRWWEGLALSVVLTAAAIGLFKFGLGMTMPILDLSAIGFRI